MLILGILGGVASGKSLVTEQLRQLGAETLDADRMGHEVLREPEVRNQIRARWGDAVFAEDGEVSRPELAKIVFAPPPHGPLELRTLEQITHPRITQRLKLRIEELQRAGTTVAVLDAPVLLKAKWNRICDSILFVDAPRDQRAARAATRGWTEAEFQARESAQESLDEKRRHANFVIDNSGTVDTTRQQVIRLWRTLTQAK